ncbi:MAG: GNAT family N-acetyltransferase [Bacteroidales bacterium]|jgi:predicted GNAT family N-acyltransferase
MNKKKPTIHCSDCHFIAFDIHNGKMFDIAKNIRYNVFVEEQRFDVKDEFDGKDAGAKHALLFHHDNPVAVCRLRATEDGVKLERMAVVKKHRQSGAGKCLIQKLMAYLGKSKDNAYLYAQKNAVNFYKKFGFITVGSLFKDAGADHYKMIYRT